MDTHNVHLRYAALPSMPSLTSELTLDSPNSSRYHASPDGLFHRRIAYPGSVLQSPTLKSPTSRVSAIPTRFCKFSDLCFQFIDNTDGLPIDVSMRAHPIGARPGTNIKQ